MSGAKWASEAEEVTMTWIPQVWVDLSVGVHCAECFMRSLYDAPRKGSRPWGREVTARVDSVGQAWELWGHQGSRGFTRGGHRGLVLSETMLDVSPRKGQVYL
jgi:hypothetical protein